MQFHLSVVLAYLDPGSGSFIVQILIASLLGSALMIKAFWRQITGIFRRGNSPAQEESQDQ
jgi:hypothetical protein